MSQDLRYLRGLEPDSIELVLRVRLRDQEPIVLGIDLERFPTIARALREGLEDLIRQGLGTSDETASKPSYVFRYRQKH